MTSQLDNIFWHSLDGAHRPYSDGGDQARRFKRGFSPILGFADPAQPAFSQLADCCAPGEQFYCDGWYGAAPPGWRVELETTMFRMLWDGPFPDSDDADAAPDAIALRPEHAQQALDLATLTRPGPFGLRTIELGAYFGYFDGERLIAMAGERLAAPGLREISGVCTHPDHQGRGYARKLVAKLVRRQLLRGERPFLHVMREKEATHQFYLRSGFRDYLESVVRVVSRLE